MNYGNPDPDQSTTELTAEQQSWKQTLDRLAKQNQQARRGLVEKMAARRHFAHLDEITGAKAEDFPQLFDGITEDYLSGRFFLEELSLFFEVSPRLSLTVYELRQEWIREYDLKTVPEFMLLDQIMLAYFHVTRLNTEVAKMLSLTEESLYSCDSPFAKLQSYLHIDNKFDRFVAADHIKEMQDVLLPFIERFNQMFLRNLRAMRDLKANPININIVQAGQVNLAQQQVNIQRENSVSGNGS